MALAKDSKIFVSGGSGMVGSAIIRRLLAQGYTNIISNYHTRKPSNEFEGKVKFFRLDLTRQEETERFFSAEKPEYVFLAAAKVGGILANDTYKAEFIYENLAIALNVIHASYTYGVKKLLNLGSSCIYPKHCPQPMKEEYLLAGPLEPTNEPYAIAKISAIKLIRYYNERYGTNFISVMPTNLYGPNDNFNLETAHVLPALLRKFHLAKLLEEGKLEDITRDIQRNPLGFGLDERIDFSNHSSILGALKDLGIRFSDPETGSKKRNLPPSFDFSSGVRVTLWGSGNVYREFLHVDDLADACVFLMNSLEAWNMSITRPHHSGRGSSFSLGLADYFINIGTGQDLTVRDLAHIIKSVVGFKGQIDYDATRPDGTPRKLLDVSKLRGLGFMHKISLEEGIRKTYEWYLSR